MRVVKVITFLISLSNDKICLSLQITKSYIVHFQGPPGLPGHPVSKYEMLPTVYDELVFLSEVNVSFNGNCP